MKQLYLEGFAIVMFLISVGLAVGLSAYHADIAGGGASVWWNAASINAHSVFPLGIDHGDQVVQLRVAISGDLLEAFPKGILNADARLVSGDDDGVFDDQR